jgi:hypothetical protein
MKSNSLAPRLGPYAPKVERTCQGPEGQDRNQPLTVSPEAAARDELTASRPAP